jgi:hypothetical protein
MSICYNNYSLSKYQNSKVKKSLVGATTRGVAIYVDVQLVLILEQLNQLQ